MSVNEESRQYPNVQTGGRSVDRSGSPVADHWEQKDGGAQLGDFEISAEGQKKVDAIKAKWDPYPASALIPVLHVVQGERGCVDPAAMEWIAGQLDITPIRVREVVTFYEMFHEEPRGKFTIGVCRTLSCYLGGAQDLTGYLCDKLSIKPHQTTNDQVFFLHELECIGACGKAPAMMIDDDTYYNLTKEKVDGILEQWRKKA